MGERIQRCRQLNVYRNAFNLAMRIFEITKNFPTEEKYSMVDQMRRSSRSVCTNLAEGWRKRRYKAAFIAKLSDSEGEAAETQVWLDFALQCRYIDQKLFDELDHDYHIVISQLINMIHNADRWLIRNKS